MAQFLVHFAAQNQGLDAHFRPHLLLEVLEGGLGGDVDDVVGLDAAHEDLHLGKSVEKLTKRNFVRAELNRKRKRPC